MNRLILFLAITLFCAIPYAGAEDFEFRGVTWGMGQAQVAAVEIGRCIAPEDGSSLGLWYELCEPVFGIGTGEVVYQFSAAWDREFAGVPAGKLKQIACRLGAYGESALAAAVDDYDRIFAVMVEQYGEPLLSGAKNGGEMACFFGSTYSGLDAAGLYAEAGRLWPLEELKFAVWTDPYKDYVVNLRLSEYNGAVDIGFVMVLHQNGPTWRSWQEKKED